MFDGIFGEGRNFADEAVLGAALKAAGRTAEFVLYADAPHAQAKHRQ